MLVKLTFRQSFLDKLALYPIASSVHCTVTLYHVRVL